VWGEPKPYRARERQVPWCITSGLNRNGGGRKPPQKDDVVDGPNPSPRYRKGKGAFHEVLGCAPHEEVGAVKRLGVDDGVVNDAEFAPVGQVDIESCPVGHDLNAFDHARRFR